MTVSDHGRVCPTAGQVEREGDVFHGGQRRNQVELLEDEPDPVPAQHGERPVVQAGSSGRHR